MALDYSKICSNLLEKLPERAKEVLLRRFGLANGKGRETLESIGENYGITRERVRQIEADALSKLKPKLKEHQKIFQYFSDFLKSSGGLKKEDILLSKLGREKFQNQVYFLLEIAEPFLRFAENKDFYPFWTIKKESIISAQKIINLILNKFEKEKKPLTLNELFKINPPAELRLDWKKGLSGGWLSSYLEISKKILKGPEGLFGLKDWPEINPRGVKDRAFLVFKKEKKPLHFMDVANLLNSKFRYSNISSPALPQTVHNELIQDPRFILVGRGIYALSEWGYYPGQVKEVISRILEEAGKPLAKEEVLEKVFKQRLVKENTILLNLSNKKHFLRDSQGKYIVKEA